MSKNAMSKIWRRLGVPEGPPESVLCAAAVFDHTLLQTSVHQWLFRRWTTFNICTQCAMALLLSYGLGRALHVHPTLKWSLTIVVSIGLFIWQAITSWNETYRMFDFVVDVDRAIRKREAEPKAANEHSKKA